MFINMSLFSFEVVLQDGRFYVPGLSESYLNKEIQKIEVIKIISFFYYNIYIYIYINVNKYL